MPDIESLVLRFFSKNEIESGEVEKLRDKAREESVRLLQKMAENKINF